MSEAQLKQVVFPVAGLGSRFLPVTKSIPGFEFFPEKGGRTLTCFDYVDNSLAGQGFVQKHGFRSNWIYISFPNIFLSVSADL